jgi:hypothetical protein
MQENSFKNLTASGVVIGGPGILSGMYVNSTSSGTVKLYNNASAATGDVIFNTITPAIGYHYLGDVQASVGVYASMAGTARDITFFIKATN